MAGGGSLSSVIHSFVEILVVFKSLIRLTQEGQIRPPLEQTQKSLNVSVSWECGIFLVKPFFTNKGSIGNALKDCEHGKNHGDHSQNGQPDVPVWFAH